MAIKLKKCPNKMHFLANLVSLKDRRINLVLFQENTFH